MRVLLTHLGQRLLMGLVLWYLILLVMGKPVYAALDTAHVCTPTCATFAADPVLAANP